MENTVKMVERGKLSRNAAVARYNIPTNLKSGSTIRKLDRSAILNTEQEPGLVIRLADVGVPVTSKMLRVKAFLSANVEDLDGSGADIENLPLSLLSKNNTNDVTSHKIDKQSTTCEIHEFLPTPKFKVKATAPRHKSLNYRAQVTKDVFDDNSANSTLQITESSSTVEDIPCTCLALLKVNTKTQKSASITDCTSTQPATNVHNMILNLIGTVQLVKKSR